MSDLSNVDAQAELARLGRNHVTIATARIAQCLSRCHDSANQDLGRKTQ
jgi:hypothetical protein